MVKLLLIRKGRGKKDKISHFSLKCVSICLPIMKAEGELFGGRKGMSRGDRKEEGRVVGDKYEQSTTIYMKMS